MIRLLLFCLLMILFGCASSGGQIGFSKDGVLNLPPLGSLKSNQTSLLLSLIPRPSSGPSPNWELISDNDRILVYAIVTEEEVWFANDSGAFLRFDGWNFLEAKGLRSDSGGVTINTEGNVKTFTVDEGMELKFFCESWKKTVLTANSVTKHEENCRSAEREYTNHIIVDSLGAITELRFTLYPTEHPYILKLI